MALKLKTNRKAQWIKVLENREKPESKKNPVLGMFQVLPLTPSEIHTLYKECETDKWYTPPVKKASPQRESVVENPFEFVVKKAQKTIINWKDIVTEDDDGNEIQLQYSKEMVETLYEYNPEVINYILEKADELSNLSAKAEEDELKN